MCLPPLPHPTAWGFCSARALSVCGTVHLSIASLMPPRMQAVLGNL